MNHYLKADASLSKSVFASAQGRMGHCRAGGRLCIVATLLLLLAFTGCSRQATNASPSASYGTNPVVSMQPHLFAVPENQMSHVQVVAVQQTNLQHVLRLPGSVTYNAFETTPVITQVGGAVTRVLAVPGQFVRKGQPMLYVSSPDFAQLRSSYLKARDAYSLAQKNDQRASDLYAHHAIAEADLLAADSARNQAQADFQQAQQSLKVVGIADPETLAKEPPSPQIPVLAPIGGEVVERLAAPGQVVQAGSTQVFTISNLTTVWVLANVFQQDLGSVHLGDAVEIQTDAYAKAFHGRISYIAPSLDPNTRTLQVRIVTNNSDAKLKKDMYVTAIVQAGEIPNAVVVPDSAVLRNSENQPFVYVEVGSNQFAQRLVTLGESQGGKTQILSGLRAAERVVADGSLFLQFANSLQR